MPYLGLFTSQESMLGAFGEDPSILDGYEVLYAEYSQEGYEGDCFVLLRKGNKFFEINGSHCSCYQFENQWRPYPTTIKALFARPNVVKAVKDLLRLSALC